jgi:hypothetical protein
VAMTVDDEQFSKALRVLVAFATEIAQTKVVFEP